MSSAPERMTMGCQRRTTYLLYSATNTSNLNDNLGLPEYSYYFVREKFRSMLEKRASVVIVAEPEREVDRIYDALSAQGHDSVFLAFCPPHRMPPPMRCPTVPVFAWEFDTIPDETWNDDPRNDWRTVLSWTGRAITHSRYSAHVIKSAMGPKFHVGSIPAPVWDDFQWAATELAKREIKQALTLEGIGPIVDSQHSWTVGMSKPRTQASRLALTARYALTWYHDVLEDLLPQAVSKCIVQSLSVVRDVIAERRLRGSRRKVDNPRRESNRIDPQEQIFLSVFNPRDGRKNWKDMLTAFCYSLADCSDATLILKLIGANCSRYMAEIQNTLAMLPPFRCRVIVFGGFLDEPRYRQLIASSTYAVNSSQCEGQCLPLMEAMSCGKPAIAPKHTGMNDYLDSEVGFVVRSSRELCSWPHDPRHVFRACRYRIDWQSLVEAYRNAYRLAKDRPEHYHRMGRAAAERMREYCSEQAVFESLQQFIQTAAVLRVVEKTGTTNNRPLVTAAGTQP